MRESFEKQSDSKEKLHKLERSGLYVFHGSPLGNIETLEPRQGEHVPDIKKPTDTILDGEPAVSATPYSDLAIFRAIINDKNIPFSHVSGFGADSNGTLEFRVSSKKVLKEARFKKGYVYVFDKKDFEPYSRSGRASEKSMEWRSHKTIKPLEVIEAHSDDLPEEKDIDIINKN